MVEKEGKQISCTVVLYETREGGGNRACQYYKENLVGKCVITDGTLCSHGERFRWKNSEMTHHYFGD